MIHAEEAETSLAIALGQRVEMDRATRDAWDRGAAVKEAGLPVDVVRPVRDAPRGPEGGRADGHAPRHHRVGRRRRRDPRQRRDRRADRLRARPPHRPGLSRDGRKGVASWPACDRPLAAALPRVAAAPVLRADADPAPHRARGRARGPAVVQRRDHHHLEPRGDPRRRVRPLRQDRRDDLRHAARHVLRRRDLRRHPRSTSAATT